MGRKKIEVKDELKHYEEDILDILKQRLIKGESVDALCKQLEISDLTLFGYVKKLKDEDINITLTDKNNEMFLKINNHPNFTKENIYKIKEDNIETKIAVISDLRFGSKCEQISMLNDIYRNFLKEGVKYVIIAGNLLEGKYNSTEESKFGDSLIANSGLGQANHFIEYFPKVEEIKTMFITGETDHTWGKELDVGKYISSQREDLTYLGPKNCAIYFNKVKIKVENIKKSGESYTIAYPPQKYSRSMSSYEDYDMIFLGGTLTAQDFPTIRDTRIFTIPSLVERTPKMKSVSQQNTMGAYEFKILYTKTGKLKNISPTLIPYYLPFKDNYLEINPLVITKDYEVSVGQKNVIILNKSDELFQRLNKLYKLMKKEESFNSLKNRLSMTENELYGTIDLLQQYGREIEVVEEGNDILVKKYFKKRRHNEIKLPKEELTKVTFGVASDTHYGSIYSQPSMVNTFAYEAYNRGINDIFHIGDISDGDYSRIRPNHIKEVFIYGATGEIEYTARTLPKYKGMTWRVICGSHDQTHMFNYGVDFGKELEKLRDDVIYLGQDRAFYNYDKCKIELFHPGGGTSRILSTKPQNGIDQMPSNTKPNLSLRGHYHKVYYMLYRNIHLLLCPCNVDQSSFMMKNELPNLMGDYFVSIWYDDNGDIQYIETEAMIFNQSDVIQRDYEHPIKYMKNKILTIK